MDWFEELTGFREQSYDLTRARLRVQNNFLTSLENGKSFQIGNFECIPLEELRTKIKTVNTVSGSLKTTLALGDVREMHKMSDNCSALFQVASQFNMLEMTSPHITPEHGVTRYQHDPTQGPACAISAGAATIYRNYFVPVNGREGQRSQRQIDGLAGLGRALSDSIGIPVGNLWEMKNGYALAKLTGLVAITKYLESLPDGDVDLLRGKLLFGLHSDVEVTDQTAVNPVFVSQLFCSALPVAYSNIPSCHWETFACLVLEAAYEATLWCAVLNAHRGKSNIVFLTLLGGGAFGNEVCWIHSAIRRALRLAKDFAIDVRIVSFHTPSTEILEIVEEFS